MRNMAVLHSPAFSYPLPVLVRVLFNLLIFKGKILYYNKYKKSMYIFTLFAYFFVRTPKTDKESFLQDKAFGTHVFYLCLRKKTNELYNLPL